MFTRNLDKAFRVVHGLDVGGVTVNDSSDYRVDLMPFSGVKKNGRERIAYSLQEMTEPKTDCFHLVP